MVKKIQQERHPTAMPVTNYQGEYEEFCRVKGQTEYEEFCREFPTFRGEYDDYCQVKQMVQAEIRSRAELARIKEQRKQLRDALLLPPIYRLGQLAVTDEFADELLSSMIEDRPPTKAERAAPPSKKLRRRADIPDDAEANFLVAKYLASHPQAGIRELESGTGISKARICGLEAWRGVIAERKEKKPTPKRWELPLTDKMLAARGQDDDPAAKLIEEEEREAIRRWLLEKANPKERAELHRMDAAKITALIEAVRGQYDKEHPERDQ